MQVVIEAPDNEDRALALESAADEGGDPTKIGDAFVLAAAGPSAWDDPAKIASAKGLLFRAGRLFQEAAQNLEGAEKAYAAIVALDPLEGTAIARLDDVRHKLKKYDALVASLLARAASAR